MSNEKTPHESQSSDPSDSDQGQAMQINDNTVDDPNPPEADPGDDHLHSRSDFDKTDQAMQINDNTVADEK